MEFNFKAILLNKFPLSNNQRKKLSILRVLRLEVAEVHQLFKRKSKVPSEDLHSTKFFYAGEPKNCILKCGIFGLFFSMYIPQNQSFHQSNLVRSEISSFHEKYLYHNGRLFISSICRLLVCVSGFPVETMVALAKFAKFQSPDERKCARVEPKGKRKT